MNVLILIPGFLLWGLLVLSRLLFTASGPIGWAMYLANVFWESVAKKWHASRAAVEWAAGILAVLLLWAGGLSGCAALWLGVILLGMEVVNRWAERRLFAQASTRSDSVGPPPATRPQLLVTLEAPFTERLPMYRLGTLWTGVAFEFEVIVANPSRVPTQTPVQVRLSVSQAWLGDQSPEISVGTISSGAVARAQWQVCPDASGGEGELEVLVECGGASQRTSVLYAECVAATADRIQEARMVRYPGARRSAFVWRGDMDLYDTSTLQSVEGLETALGLASRYCFPQTMCLSTRLSLDEAAAQEWADHYGVDRGAAEIPRFIQWLREDVDLRHRCAYPAQSDRPYLMELGNHGHLHYDTATSAAPGNGWRSHARMGAGPYSWMGEDTSSFGEQRDNVLEAARWCERLLDFTPRSWAKPGRCNDADTPRAVQAAGCSVQSGSDIRARDNVLFQPPPHHPGGTDAVELTTRYPCDPQHIYHWGMLQFWLHRSCRLGLPMVYMCHQHMRQFEGPACTRITEQLLRSVIADIHGECYIDTLFGIGEYWRQVLSPKTRQVSVTLTGTRLEVENRSSTNLDRVPVDLVLADGKHSTVLFSVQGGSSRTIDLSPPLGTQEN